MAVPSVVVYRLEGHTTGLDGPRSRRPQCAGGGPTHQTRDALPALDSDTPSQSVCRLADVLLFSDIGLSLVHHYRVHKRGLPHVAFRKNYMSQLRALLPLPAVKPIEGGLADPECSSVVDSTDVVCASPRPSRRAFARRRPIRVMETPIRLPLISQYRIHWPRRGQWCLTSTLKCCRGQWT